MAAPDVAALAAVVIANLSVGGAGVSVPLWGQVVDRVLMLQVDPADIPRTVTPPDIDGLAAALIAGGATTPYWLGQISNIVVTYPYNRGGDSGEIMPDTPWG